MALDFSLANPNNAMGASTPSRAFTLTLTGSGTLGSTASFALSDGGAGGVFFPASPVTIASGQTVGATTQFCYIPASGASGTITITAACTGGLTATHALAMAITTNATVVVHDSFTGTASTDLASHTPDTGGAWSKNTVSGSSNALLLTGSGGLMVANSGAFGEYQNASTNAADHDISYTVNCIDHSHSEFGPMAAIRTSILDGYWFTEGGVGSAPSQFNGYDNGTGLGGNILQAGTLIATGTHTLLLAARSINGSRYWFCMIDGATIHAPTVETTLTGTHPGITGYSAAGQTSTNGHIVSNYYARNADWAAGPLIALSGPTSGFVATASSNFTVAWSNISGTAAIVTPSDSAWGGTFTPATVTTSGASGSATFTYTAPSAGTNNLSIANNQIYAESGSPISFTATATALQVTFPSANVFLSPYTWRTASGSAIANTSGAYLKFTVTGTANVAARIDVTANTSDMPTLKYRYKTGGGYDSGWLFSQAATSPSGQLLALASGLTTGSTYTFEIAVIGGQNNQAAVWASGAAQTKIDHLQFDQGSTVSLPTLRSKRALILGDSYLTSYFGGTQTPPYYGYIDYTLSWGPKAARALGAEFGQCGIGGSGWKQSGNGGYGAGPSYWNQLDSTHTRDFTLAPDYVFAAWGINDHRASWTEAQVQAAVTAWLTAARTALPSAWIFVVEPFGGQTADDSGGNYRPNQVPIAAAVTAFADARVKAIDVGNDFATAFPFAGSTWASPDGIHASSTYHGDFAASIAETAKGFLDGASQVFPVLGSSFIKGS